MATKDWKKHREYTMGTQWRNKITGSIISVSDIYDKTYNYIFRSPSKDSERFVKKFKTKSQALAYAKSYMRTH